MNRLKLTPEQQAAVFAWHDAVKALGTRRAYLERAIAEYTAKRRALGSAKQKAFELGIASSTFRTYYLRRQKCIKRSFDSSPRRSGTASATPAAAAGSAIAAPGRTRATSGARTSPSARTASRG